MGDWTSVSIKKKTLVKLNKFQGAIQMRTGKKFSYDVIVNALIDVAPEIPMPLLKRVKDL